MSPPASLTGGDLASAPPEGTGVSAAGRELASVPPEATGVATAGADLQRYVRSMLAASAASTVVYLSLIRGLLEQRVFGNFYDLQARALLDGRFDVPSGSLGIEAFVNDGRDYLYFPPGPSFLRMPVLAVTDRFDGRLTAVSMLVAWCLTVTLVALLMWRVRDVIRGSAPLSRWEAAGYGFVLVAATAGSVVLFLGSIPWVYHEAYAWAIAMALGSVFCLIGVIQRPTTLGIIATGLFTLGAVMSRTTVGWACAGAVLLAAVLLPRRAPTGGDRHLWWKLYLAGSVPIGVGMAVNWAKFRHPYLFPIDQQVFTSLNQHRRDAIAANGGDLFSPNMIWSTSVNYFRPNGIRFVSVFPYITLPPHIAASYGGGFIDQANRTGSVLSFAPLLFGLSIWGVWSSFRRRSDDAMKWLRIPLLGVLAIPAGIMFYAYMAHRYTSEFAPLLILAGTIGFVDLARRLEGSSRRRRRLTLGVIAGLALFSVAAQLAASVNTRALANPGEPVLEEYVSRQASLSARSGHPLDGYVNVSEELPSRGPADEIRIVGECDAYFLGAGDEFRPWVEIATRDLELVVTPERLAGRTNDLELARFIGHRTTRLMLVSGEGEQLRLILEDGIERVATDWLSAEAGTPLTVAVTPDDVNHDIRVDGDVVLTLPREAYDVDWRWMPNVLIPTSIDRADAERASVTVNTAPTPALETCAELLGRHQG